jgi:hypothetical protein
VKRRVAVRPQARFELIEAAEWYDDRRNGLGAALVTAFEQTIGRIVRSPLGYQIVFDEVRRAPLRAFPYGVMYRVADDEIVVTAFVHHRRDPAFWRSRA